LIFFFIWQAFEYKVEFSFSFFKYPHPYSKLIQENAKRVISFYFNYNFGADTSLNLSLAEYRFFL